MASQRESKTQKISREYSQNSRHMGLGITFALTILLCMGAGWWLDGKWGTQPLFLLLGTFLGAITGFVKLYRTLVSEGENKEETP